MTAVRPLPRRGPSLLPVAQPGGAAAFAVGQADTVDDHRPFVVGYVDAGKLCGADGAVRPEAVKVAKTQIADYADEHGLRLSRTYVDYPSAGRSQFRTLLIAVTAWAPQLVLVPSLDHVASPPDVSPALRVRLDRITRTVIVRLPEGGAA